MELHLYEVQHPTIPGIIGAKDWVIASNEQEAMNILKSYNQPGMSIRTCFHYCRINKIDQNLQTMTREGIKTVQQIINQINEPFIFKLNK